jgi:hypothetical protein
MSQNDVLIRLIDKGSFSPTIPKQITMNKKLYFVLLLLASNFAFAQDTFLWPIPGKQAGDGILYRPQDYIGVADAQTQAELNFGELVIGAPLETPVLCPVDGKISSALLGYRNSWSCSSIAFAQQTGNFEQDSLLFLEWDNMTQEKIRNTSLHIGVQTSDGKTVWIDGIRPTRLFKTGEKIHQGDTLGTVGYLYKKIKQPCICISISKNSKADDPMTPFGLKTTFIPPKVNNKTQLTREEAQADIDGMMAALEDAFPGLYDYTPKEEFDNFLKQKMAAIGETIDISDFEMMARCIIGKIRDSHTTVISPMKLKNGVNSRPTSVLAGWFNDTLRIWRAVPRYQEYLSKEVVSINGIPAGIVGVDVDKLLHEMVSSAKAKTGNIRREAQEALALSLAENAAIVYGQVLSSLEMESLMNDLFASKASARTPDGKLIYTILADQVFDDIR